MANEIALAENKDIIYSSFRLLRCGLEAIGKPTFEEWESVGEFIKKANGAVHFWIGDWLNYGEKAYGETYAQAIDETGFDYQTVANDKWVASKIEFSRRRESLSFRHHEDVAGLEPEAQDSLLQKAIDEVIPSTKFRQTVQDYKKSLLIVAPLPEGKFDVVYADPPWEYEFTETYSREVENKYPTMKLDDIKAISVPSADKAILFLWATAPKLEEAIQVMNSWGFTYRSDCIWDKEIIGMGYYFRGQHEHLLVGTKGDYPVPKESVRVSSVYKEKRGEHSRKPDYFYELIEKYYPNSKYIELFARRQHNEKWTIWGAEAPK